MRVREIMSAPVEIVAPDMRVGDAAGLMRALRVHHLIVKEMGTIVGVLSSSDLRSIAANGHERCVADIMSRHVATIDQNETVRRAANLMRGRQVGALAVVDKGGQLRGIVTISDLLELLGKGVDRRESGPRASLHYRTRPGKQAGRQRW